MCHGRSFELAIFRQRGSSAFPKSLEMNGMHNALAHCICILDVLHRLDSRGSCSKKAYATSRIARRLGLSLGFLVHAPQLMPSNLSMGVYAVFVIERRDMHV